MCGFAPVSQEGCDQTGLCIGKLALRKRSSKTKKRNDTWVVPYNVIVSMLPHSPAKNFRSQIECEAALCKKSTS